jgi:hypothetical protein
VTDRHLGGGKHSPDFAQPALPPNAPALDRVGNELMDQRVVARRIFSNRPAVTPSVALKN